MVLNYPSNPTAQVVGLDFYRDAIALAKKHDIWVLSDLAYSEIYFGEPSPSILEIPGAKDIAVEVNSLSKTYSMAGFRVGMAVGNSRLIAALGRVKSYLDYGAYTPIQVAASAALLGGLGLTLLLTAPHDPAISQKSSCGAAQMTVSPLMTRLRTGMRT